MKRQPEVSDLEAPLLSQTFTHPFPQGEGLHPKRSGGAGRLSVQEGPVTPFPRRVVLTAWYPAAHAQLLVPKVCCQETRCLHLCVSFLPPQTPHLGSLSLSSKVVLCSLGVWLNTRMSTLTLSESQWETPESSQNPRWSRRAQALWPSWVPTGTIGKEAQVVRPLGAGVTGCLPAQPLRSISKCI